MSEQSTSNPLLNRMWLAYSDAGMTMEAFKRIVGSEIESLRMAASEFVRLQQELCGLLDTDPEGDSAALHSRIVAGIKAWKAEVRLTTHKIITCGVAASHPDANLSRTKAYGSKWDSPQAQEVRKLRDERDSIKQKLTAAEQLAVRQGNEIRRLRAGEKA